MRSCPKCGSEIGDNDTFCEKCGAYAGGGSQVPPSGKTGSILPVLLILLSVFLLISVLGPFMANTQEHTYTLTIDGVGIECDKNTSMIYTEDGKVPVYFLITVGDETVKTGTYQVAVNTGTSSVAENNKYTFKSSSDNPHFKIYMKYRTGPVGSQSEDDYIDLYDVTPYIVDGGVPEKLGVSGISVGYNEFTDGKLTLKGDDYPKGILELSVSRN